MDLHVDLGPRRAPWPLGRVYEHTERRLDCEGFTVSGGAVPCIVLATTWLPEGGGLYDVVFENGATEYGILRTPYHQP